MIDPDDEIRLVLPAKHQYLNLTGAAIDALLTRMDCPARASYDVQVALQEICANIVDHAYEDRPGGQIQVTITPRENALEITVRDRGIAFDPDTVIDPPLGQLQERGFGLFFARQMLDGLEYAVVDGENCWRLYKKFEPVGSEVV